MTQPPTSLPRSRRVPRGRIAVACLTAAGLAGSMLASTSGAVTSHAVKGVVISAVKSSKFGTILVSGTTLYTLKPSAAACSTKCLKYWPEVVLPKGVARATAGSGVTASKLGIIMRPGGVRQVTYAGKPLYWFSKDTAPGQVNGVVTDTWGKWSVVVTKAAAASSGGTTTTTVGSGGGVGF